MIIASLGKLSVAQDITASDEDSTNVIQIAAVDYAAFSDLWWVVDTYTAAAGDGSDTFEFQLVMAQTETPLATFKTVAKVDITGIADLRLATPGRHIVALNVGKMMVNMLDTDASDYVYIGQKNTLSAGATISINAILSQNEPDTEPHRQVVTSPVTVPAVASAGSGF